MKRYLNTSLILMLLFGSGVLAVYAQGGQASTTPAASTAPTTPASGFRAEFLNQLADVEKKLVGLAEAIPQEKYTWRPGEGVRSVSEVFLHVAGGNFAIPRAVGVQPPADLNLRGFDKSTTDKAKVVETLKQSFEHVRQAALKTPDADLDKAVKLFGSDSSTRGVFFLLANHMHEHLGQSIAYARMTGIVPPWTAERQAQQQPPPRQ
jgi:uncharacterized damage-inducible protein DinB